MAIHHFLCLICPATLAARRQDTFASETLSRLSLLHSSKTLGFRTLWLLLLFTATSTAFSIFRFKELLSVSFFIAQGAFSVSCFFVAEDVFSVFSFFVADNVFPVSCFFIAADSRFFASAGSFPVLRFFPAEQAAMVPSPVAAEGVPPALFFAARCTLNFLLCSRCFGALFPLLLGEKRAFLPPLLLLRFQLLLVLRRDRFHPWRRSAICFHWSTSVLHFCWSRNVHFCWTRNVLVSGRTS